MEDLLKSSAMISSSDERYSLAPKGSRDAGNATSKAPDLGTRTRYWTPPSNPPSHPAATTEVGQLLDLGLALGHQRFELVSLAGHDNAGMVAAHAWAEVQDCSNSTATDPRAMPASRARSRSRPRPPPVNNDDDVRFEAGHQQDALKEVTSAHIGLVLRQARLRAGAVLCESAQQAGGRSWFSNYIFEREDLP